jgi:hypothetical protein
MGNVPGPVFGIVGVLSMLAGVLTIAVGMVIIAGAVRGKWLEALSRRRQWAVAIVLGSLLTGVGAWLLDVALFGYKMLP